MSDIGFTKGDWIAERGDEVTDRDVIPYFVYVNNIVVADLYHGNVKANAHLISAAPDMFFYVKERADKGCADAKLICAKAQGQDTSNGEG